MTKVDGSKLIIVDNFAGGGGASVGMEAAFKRPVTLAINHDPAAIAMHMANHPHTAHLQEDVWQVNLLDIDPRLIGLAWFSPDCRHFSRAKGGRPVKHKIRSLAWYVVKFAEFRRPRVLILENVCEFEEWGPLIPARDAAGKPLRTPQGGPALLPDKSRKGQTFRRWARRLRALGYVLEWRRLDSADYGAHTHRRRLFLVGRCDGEPIVWPQPTHGPGRAHPYKAAAECLDFSLPCPSIYARKRPLAPKTHARLAMGIYKFVLEKSEPFLVNTQHGGDWFRGQPAGDPLGTVTARHGYGLVTPLLVECANSNWSAGARPVDIPAPTVTAQPKGGSWAVATPAAEPFIMTNTSGHAPRELKAPLPTVTTGDHHYLAAPQVATFLAKHYGGVTGQDVRRPVGTITSIDHHSTVAVHLSRFFGQSVGNDLHQPAPTATAAVNKSGLVSAHLASEHLLKFYGTNVGSDCSKPLPTTTAGGNHVALSSAYLIRYFSHGSGLSGQPLTIPKHTSTCRARDGLATVALDGGWLFTPQMLARAKSLARLVRRVVGVKADKHLFWVRDGRGKTFPLLFKALGDQCYILHDCGLRMLEPRELARAQGFPENYILTGSKSSQVARIGNSVVPLMAELLARGNCPYLIKRGRRGRNGIDAITPTRV